MKNYLIIFVLLIFVFNACRKDAEVVTVEPDQPTIDSVPTNIDTTTYPKYYLVDCEYEQDVLDRNLFGGHTITRVTKTNSPLIYYSKDSLYFNPAQYSDISLRGKVDINNVFGYPGSNYFKRINDTIYFESIESSCSWYVTIKGRGVIRNYCKAAR